MVPFGGTAVWWYCLEVESQYDGTYLAVLQNGRIDLALIQYGGTVLVVL